MHPLLQDSLLVLVFVLIGGVFAASEFALVSLRESQVRSMAARGGSGATVAKLTENPNTFLSAVQVGVTLAGFFSASYGASTIAPYVSPYLVDWGLSERVAGTAAFIGITLIVSYMSLVFGEMVPKRLAMQGAEKFSMIVARPLNVIALVLRPVIWLLDVSTNLVLRVLGRDPHARAEEMDAEELRQIVAGHEGLGAEERQIVTDLLAVGERSVQEVMTPRTEVEFLDADTPIEDARATVGSMEHSRYPVRGENDDDILGFVHVRDFINPGPEIRFVRDLVRETLYFPTGKEVLSTLTEMRRTHAHFAVIVDEYGGTDGIVTMEDVVEEFVGEIHDEYDREEPEVVEGAGADDVSGLLSRAEIQRLFDVELPEGPYDTLAGYIMSELGRLPAEGDAVAWGDATLTVRTLDGRRIDRVTVTRPEPEPEDTRADGADASVAGADGEQARAGAADDGRPGPDRPHAH
ncbi:hemolysin family protein [Georgenia sp. Z1491]|uniref:hemolysin family protein n=1 Tax=Georgenia sp. Z1491 TaxID=3416707 RepID=UPI003CE6B7C3